MAILGDVKALIQANNGDVLAGTNSSARLYKSSDNGLTWTLLATFGSGADSINAFAKIQSSGHILAAMSGASGTSGIWLSVNNGSNWSKVWSHPNGTGYLDITAIQSGNRLVAVGYPVTNSAHSPIVYSNSSGAFGSWNYVSTPDYHRTHLSVASYRESAAATPFSGEPSAYGTTLVFIGVDGYYTAMHGVNQATNQLVAFGTYGGGAGNGGLDMVSFLHKDAAGVYRRDALWAVKGAADVTDTNIWHYPGGGSSGFNFALLYGPADGILYNAMYVDTTPDHNSILRTIWAGANGAIYVSYNSGLSWALATTAPVGQIYSFVRTTSGVLIAGGASGEIFLFSGTGGEGGGNPPVDPPDEPEPPGTPGVATSRFLGRLPTCENEVFVSNKFSFSNISHVFHYNGSTYSNLQFGAVPPYELLGTNPTVNKAVYFGSKTNDSNVPGGTFSDLNFDITQIQENLTVVWEYWNGASWSALNPLDNTDQFKIPGVNNVSWAVPPSWSTTTVNGITGYWVRARISAVGSDPKYPIHDNRFIYTTLLPYIDISADQVKGDLPAVGRVKYHSQSGFIIERVVCGLRSLDRGSNFNPYINISDTQLPFGITMTQGSATGISWVNDSTAPTGRRLSVNLSSAGDLNDWKDLVTITLSTSIAREFHGYYRAFVRCLYNNATTQGWRLRLQMRFGSGGMRLNTNPVYPTANKEWEAVDFGQLAISTREIACMGGSLSDQMQIVVQGYTTATARQLYLYDVVLMPIDEWAIDAYIPDLTPVGTPQIANQNFLDVDSITNPKIAISALNRNPAGLIVSKYQAVNNGPMILQANKDQRLWFMVLHWNDYWASYPEAPGSVQVYKQQQYLAYRGVS